MVLKSTRCTHDFSPNASWWTGSKCDLGYEIKLEGNTYFSLPFYLDVFHFFWTLETRRTTGQGLQLPTQWRASSLGYQSQSLLTACSHLFNSLSWGDASHLRAWRWIPNTETCENDVATFPPKAIARVWNFGLPWFEQQQQNFQIWRFGPGI